MSTTHALSSPLLLSEEIELMKHRERLSSITSVSLDEQVEFLEEKLGVLQAQCGGAARKMKEKALRKELNALRRQIKAERKATRAGSGEISKLDSSPVFLRPPLLLHWKYPGVIAKAAYREVGHPPFFANFFLMWSKGMKKML